MKIFTEPEVIIAILTSTALISYFLFTMPIKSIIELGTIDEEAHEKGFGGIVVFTSALFFSIVYLIEKISTIEQIYFMVLIIVFLVSYFYLENKKNKVLVNEIEYIRKENIARVWLLLSVLSLIFGGIANNLIIFKHINDANNISTLDMISWIIEYYILYCILVAMAGQLYALKSISNFKEFEITGKNLIDQSNKINGYIIGRCNEFLIVKPMDKWDEKSKMYIYCGKSRAIFIKRDNINTLIRIQ